jgi:restriction system protein
MPIPDYQAVMLPLLKIAADGKEHQIQDATNALAEQFRLTEEERKELLRVALIAFFATALDGLARI